LKIKGYMFFYFADSNQKTARRAIFFAFVIPCGLFGEKHCVFAGFLV